MRMQDRVAIVTGAGGGLGKAQVRLLASEGRRSSRRTSMSTAATS